MTIRYIADTHFENPDIIAYDGRPFDSVAEMNQTLADNWNRVVTNEDFTWILGDFCDGGVEDWRRHLQSLRGRKGLILGNHDDANVIAETRDCFEEIDFYREISDGGRQVVLCHYPIVSFHNHYFGWYHLYGHVHTSFEAGIAENGKRLLRKLYVREDVCRMANTGAMVGYMDYTPRTLDEIFSPARF